MFSLTRAALPRHPQLHHPDAVTTAYGPLADFIPITRDRVGV
jgi:hypothetical protein